MKMPLPGLLVVVAMAVLASGCTFPSSRRTVSSRQANVLQRVDTGTVTAVREVNIEGRRTPVGTLGGGLIGAAAAGGGKGVGGAIMSAAGGVAGAVAGQAVEEAVTRERAQEITVRLDDGSSVVVTQEASSGLFKDGDRVRVLHSNGAARVAMLMN